MLCALAVSSITARRCRFRSCDIHHDRALHTVSHLHGIVSSWSHNLCAVRPSEIFTLPETSSYATNSVISDKLSSDWKTRKVVGTYAKGCARSLAEEWKVVASVVEWLMPGNCTSAA